MTVRVEWHGDEIVKEFLKVKAKDEKTTADNIGNAAMGTVPVDTGALRSSIKVKDSKHEDGGYVVTLGDSKTFYASFVELGTPKGTSSKKASNRGFFRRAMLSNWKGFKKDLETRMDGL